MKPIKQFLSVYKIGDSNIHGQGMFSAQPIRRGAEVGVICVGKKVTPGFGQWINHSKTPNGIMKKSGENWIYVALEDIPMNKELTVNYDHTPSFILGSDPSWS